MKYQFFIHYISLTTWHLVICLTLKAKPAAFPTRNLSDCCRSSLWILSNSFRKEIYLNSDRKRLKKTRKNYHLHSVQMKYRLLLEVIWSFSTFKAGNGQTALEFLYDSREFSMEFRSEKQLALPIGNWIRLTSRLTACVVGGVSLREERDNRKTLDTHLCWTFRFQYTRYCRYTVLHMFTQMLFSTGNHSNDRISKHWVVAHWSLIFIGSI